MALSILLLLGGLVLLTKSADEFVTGSVRMASLLKVTPVVIGAVIMGFGTSAPEMLVSGIAAVQGDVDFGVGNLVGSNIANLSLVLGVGALMLPLTVYWTVLKREAPMTLAAVMLFGWAIQGGIQLWESALLFALLLAALWFIVFGGKKLADTSELDDVMGDKPLSTAAESLRTLLGLVGTIAGAWILIQGGTGIADELGLSKGFVGLTIVAIGTSLPELVTTVVAARRGHPDLIIGNLLGSNLLNSLGGGAVLGLASGGSTLVDERLAGLPVLMMVGVALFAVLAMITYSRVTRVEGLALVVAYFVSLPFMPR